ncbi:outer membrane protein assembly factor BamE [Marinospirillum perlucidum]|uniref:outer membrane protein assembly factor BamE n=1 Tax=Marinospirillum perlucidum TaxID=1982602 RepID=UPI000DF3CC17|nr:outer membrane protein assembly factor BamE [Marinospirillum perlucidum]
MKKPTKLLTYILLVVVVSGCSWLAPHKREIQQGNLFEQEQVDQLELGMSREQVRYLLGTPLIQPLGKGQHWYYVYQLRQGQELLQRKQLHLVFSSDAGEEAQLTAINFEALAEEEASQSGPVPLTDD